MRSCQSIAFLLVAVLILSAVPAVAQPGAHLFWGNFVGEATSTRTERSECAAVPNWIAPLLTTATVEGTIAEFGHATVGTTHCPTQDGLAALGVAVFTIEGGDQLYVNYTARTTVPKPLIVQEGDATIVGGSGRFENASGRLRMTTYLAFEGRDDPTWPIGIVFAGTITY